MNKLVRALMVLAALVILVGQVDAMRIAFRAPALRAINSEMVLVGKVTGFDKDLVQAAPFPGAKDTVGYKIAIVKVENGLIGAEKLTEIKVGFIPPPVVDPNAKPPVVGGPLIRPIRPGIRAPELKEGQVMLLFLAKHPTGDFYILPGINPPIDVTNEQGKKDLEAVKKIAATLADPMKGLKSDDSEVRSETAAVLVMKYRSSPAAGGEVDQVPIPVDESRLILKALTEGDWTNVLRPVGPAGPTPVQAFYALGLTAKDGWVPPAIVQPQPGAPPVNFNAIQKDAFAKWLDGEGKNYQIKKVVPKVKK